MTPWPAAGSGCGRPCPPAPMASRGCSVRCLAGGACVTAEQLKVGHQRHLAAGLPARLLGTVKGDRLVVAPLEGEAFVDLAADAVAATWRDHLPSAFGTGGAQAPAPPPHIGTSTGGAVRRRAPFRGDRLPRCRSGGRGPIRSRNTTTTCAPTCARRSVGQRAGRARSRSSKRAKSRLNDAKVAACSIAIAAGAPRRGRDRLRPRHARRVVRGGRGAPHQVPHTEVVRLSETTTHTNTNTSSSGVGTVNTRRLVSRAAGTDSHTVNGTQNGSSHRLVSSRKPLATFAVGDGRRDGPRARR